MVDLFSAAMRRKYGDTIVHNDPVFDESIGIASYGDLPRVNVRAVNLLSARRGDLLLFLANLVHYENGVFHKKKRGLHFIGLIEIDNVFDYRPSQGCLLDLDGYSHHLEEFSYNAHVNHLLTIPHVVAEEPFTLFEGSPRSALFKIAVPITGRMFTKCFRDKSGDKIDISRFRSIDACVGAYTRTVRAHFDLNIANDRKRFTSLWAYVLQKNAYLDLSDALQE